VIHPPTGGVPLQELTFEKHVEVQEFAVVELLTAAGPQLLLQELAGLLALPAQGHQQLIGLG
jgi:hypothetical protein